MKKDCRGRKICKKCKGFHPTSLHIDSPASQVQNSNEGIPEVTSHRVEASNSEKHVECYSHSLIVPVWLRHEQAQDKQLVYAPLDDQSDACFIKDTVLEKLKANGPEVQLKLSTVLAEEVITCKRIDGLIVQGVNEVTTVRLPGAYTRADIPAKRGQIPRPETARDWPHLSRIADQLMPYREDVEVGLLIGANCARAIKPSEVIPGLEDDPYAKKTALGWGVIGVVSPNKNEDDNHYSCHRIASLEVQPSSGKRMCHFAFKTQTKEVFAPAQWAKMLELDFNETSREEQPLSLLDRKFLSVLESNIRHRDDDHYEIPLPLKEEGLKLPNNRILALSRLERLKQRLKRDRKYREHYEAFMKEMIDKGQAERVPDEELHFSDGRVWYIPHHGVYHPQKPDKIRVVFDASAEFMGESLNRHLLQGPDLTNSLNGVLCRFRKEPIAFTCDVKGMFHQVYVSPDHRNLIRFLWWSDGNIDSQPTEFRMTVHLFGATSSPGCANFALKRTADDFEELFGSEPAKFVKEDFYVDDGLKSVPSAVQASALIESTKCLLAKGGFNLHKFISNSKNVIKAIPKEQQASGIKELDLSRDVLPIERALGVQWCVQSDSLQFRVVLKDKPLTRRGILSSISSIYDPLGLAAPFLLTGKQILQDLCRTQAAWDETVPDSIRERWEKWRRELHELAELKIRRCYKPDNFGDVKSVELHSFSDASVNGYGQCSYLRMVNNRNEVHCTLVMAKSRVTPLKPVTVPRLELTAAVVSTKISSFLQKELSYEDISEFFWTDSKVVLGYISNEARRFHTFVANRVQEIRNHASPDQWRYVDTKENPADDASRGLGAKALIRSDRWWNGPNFLWQPLPVEPNFDPQLSPDDPEIRKITALTTKSIEHSPLLDCIEHFSDWYRAKRAIAVCLLFIERMKLRVRKDKDNSFRDKSNASQQDSGRIQHDQPSRFVTLRVKDLQRAELLLIKAVQYQAFEREIEALANKSPKEVKDANIGKSVKRTSPVHRLKPILDADGVLRVGGRLPQADLPYAAKHPVLLPKKAHLTNLIIRHFHERSGHQDRSRTHAEIRSSGFWIVNGSSLVGHHISKCIICRKLRAAPQQQLMAELPTDRLEQVPPFTFSAVDYFGPFYIREGRKEMKRYGVLFTCMASRAIHLEIAASLTTDSFLNAYRRFVCRRGPIQQLRSDQGTNFVGAKNELQAALNEMNHERIQRELLKDNCDWFTWKMKVPHASHMGGVWERQIRTVRSVLTGLLQTHGSQLDDESLRTLMIEAEAIVNSRPLTTDDLADPDSLDVLTPNHLLTMKSSVILAPPGNFPRADVYSKKRWRRVQQLTNEFWQRWRKSYLQSLQTRQKWTTPQKNLEEGDIVILRDEGAPRNSWKLARVEATYPDADGYVRKVKVAVADQSRQSGASHYERPIHGLILLMSRREQKDRGFPAEEP